MGGARGTWLLLVALTVCTTPANAHLVNSGFGPFYDGFAHPLISPEDLLPIAALTLLAAQSGAREGRWLLAVLPAAWIIGEWVGWTFSVSLLPLWVNPLTTTLVGVAVAANLRLPLAALLAVGVFTGFLHGFGNGAEAGEGASSIAIAIVGTACCVAAVISLLAGQLASVQAQWARLSVRVSGSWIAAIGLLMVGWAARA